jgi:hypothetical protein
MLCAASDAGQPGGHRLEGVQPRLAARTLYLERIVLLAQDGFRRLGIAQALLRLLKRALEPGTPCLESAKLLLQPADGSRQLLLVVQHLIPPRRQARLACRAALLLLRNRGKLVPDGASLLDGLRALCPELFLLLFELLLANAYFVDSQPLLLEFLLDDSLAGGIFLELLFDFGTLAESLFYSLFRQADFARE